MTTKTIRYKTNPFIEGMEIRLKRKNVRITTLGKENNILVNEHSGEVASTHVVAHKLVDASRFIKTLADYTSFTFDLSKAGNKALRVLMWTMQDNAINKDTVTLDKYTLEAFHDVHKDFIPPLKLSYPTFARGLGELDKAKLIAKTQRAGIYFINIRCVFNGDRHAFTTIIQKDTKENRELIGLENKDDTE